MAQLHRKPLGLSRGAYRPYRRDFVDWLEYADKLDPKSLEFMERFSREYYDADNRLLKSSQALHRDRLEVDKDVVVPKRWRRWWGRQGELFLEVAASAINLACDREVARVRHGRRECYQLQNLAHRDIYAAKGVAYLEDLGAESWLSDGEAPPARSVSTQARGSDA